MLTFRHTYFRSVSATQALDLQARSKLPISFAREEVSLIGDSSDIETGWKDDVAVLKPVLDLGDCLANKINYSKEPPWREPDAAQLVCFDGRVLFSALTHF